MNWKLKHKLFGWEYVFIKNSAASYITRVYIAPNGERIFEPYSFQVNIIPNPLPLKGELIAGWHVIPLTPAITANPELINPIQESTTNE